MEVDHGFRARVVAVEMLGSFCENVPHVEDRFVDSGIADQQSADEGRVPVTVSTGCHMVTQRFCTICR